MNETVIPVRGDTPENQYDVLVGHGLLGRVPELLLSLIHISEPTRQCCTSRMPSSA